MRTLGKWMIWLGGLSLLYIDMRPIVEDLYRAYAHGDPFPPFAFEDYVRHFARPVFVLGVMCAAALPDLAARRKRRQIAAFPPPATPGSAVPPPASGPAAPPAAAEPAATPSAPAPPNPAPPPV